MAATIATRRAALSALLGKLHLSPLRPLAAVRSLNSSAQPPDVSVERNLDVDRRPDEPSAVAVRRRRRGGDIIPSFFDAFDPFNPGRSVGQLLSFMDQMMENPFAGSSGGFRPGWSAREDEKALYIRVEMPGLGKEDVRVTAEQNAIVIKGEKAAAGEEEEEVGRRRYSGRIELPPNSYRVDEIKAEMRNGVLKVVVPKVKEEERKDVIQVQVE